MFQVTPEMSDKCRRLVPPASYLSNSDMDDVVVYGEREFNERRHLVYHFIVSLLKKRKKKAVLLKQIN